MDKATSGGKKVVIVDQEGSYRRSYHIIIQAEHGWGERRQGECSIGDATKSTLLQELNFEGTLSLDKAVHG